MITLTKQAKEIVDKFSKNYSSGYVVYETKEANFRFILPSRHGIARDKLVCKLHLDCAVGSNNMIQYLVNAMLRYCYRYKLEFK